MRLRDTVCAVFFAMVAALVAASCSRRTFSVPTSSMAPTIPPGSQVVGDMEAYSRSSPQGWDIILFDPPPFAGQGQVWAMRPIALPGEQVSFAAAGGILINGQQLKLPLEVKAIHWQLPTGQTPTPISHPFTVPLDSFYVLGDNSPHANDSRFWAAVPRSRIFGKVLLK